MSSGQLCNINGLSQAPWSNLVLNSVGCNSVATSSLMISGSTLTYPPIYGSAQKNNVDVENPPVALSSMENSLLTAGRNAGIVNHMILDDHGLIVTRSGIYSVVGSIALSTDSDCAIAINLNFSDSTTAATLSATGSPIYNLALSDIYMLSEPQIITIRGILASGTANITVNAFSISAVQIG